MPTTDVPALLSAITRAAAEALAPEELCQSALPLLQQLLGGSGLLLFRFDEWGIVHGLCGSLAEDVPVYARELFASDPIQQLLYRVDPQPQTVLTSALLDRESFHASPAYADFYRRRDAEYMLGMWLTRGLRYGTPGMTGVLLTRSGRSREFGRRDIEQAMTVLPHLQAVVRRAERLEALGKSRDTLSALLAKESDRPCLTVGPHGRLLWASPEALRVAAHLLTREGCIEPLRSAVLMLALPSGRPQAAPLEIVLPAGPGQQRPLRAELAVLRLADGSTAVAVCLSPRRTRHAIGPLVARHQLTPAEARVLEPLVEGLSNREIAGRLAISLETVKTHVRHILSKLDVQTRTQAVLLAAGWRRP